MTVTLNQVIYHVRRLKGLDQRDVAHSSGISRPTIIAIEKGAAPTAEQLAGIEKALGVKVSDPRVVTPLTKLLQVLQ